MTGVFQQGTLSFEQIDQFDAFGIAAPGFLQSLKYNPHVIANADTEPRNDAPIEGTPGDDIFEIGYDYRTAEIDGGEGEDLIAFSEGDYVNIIFGEGLGELGNLRPGLTSIEGFRGTDQEDVFQVWWFERDTWTGDLVLEGLGGDDYLYSAAGNDIIRGGDGDDFIGVGGGNDFADGGEGNDRLIYSNSIATYPNLFFHVDMRTGDVFADGSGGADTFINIENIQGGSSGADIVIGNDEDNQIFMTMGGEDHVEGMGGDDYISVAVVGGYIDGGDGHDNFDLQSSLRLAEDADGDGRNDLLDIAVGGTINLETGEVTDGFGNSALIYNFESATGTSLDDTLIGDDTDNTLFGAWGNDTLMGAGGDDIIYGDGADIMTGGAGSDVFYFLDNSFEFSALGYRLDGLTITDFTAEDTLTFFSDFIFRDGNQLDQQLFLKFVGTQAFSGTETFMEIRYEHVDGDTLLYLDMDGNGEAEGSFTLIGIHHLEGTESEDQIEMSITTSPVNTIGTDGDDVLVGTYEGDALNGGRGSDLIDGRSGNDAINGGGHTDFIFGGIGADRLNGGAGDDKMFGGDDSDTFVFGQGSGVDIVGDFSYETDTIEIRHVPGVTGYDDLVMEQVGDDVSITAGEIEILLRDTPLDALHAGHFTFVTSSGAESKNAPDIYEWLDFEPEIATAPNTIPEVEDIGVDYETYDVWVLDDWMLG